MGLSAREKKGCKKMLDYLCVSDLISLCETVAKETIRKPVKADLIERIIESSKTAEELLNRKKVFKDTILKYLSNEDIFMFAKSTKSELIQKVLEHWGSTGGATTAVRSVTVKSSPTSAQRQQEIFETDLGQIYVQINNMSLNDSKTQSQGLSYTSATRPKTSPSKPQSTTVSVTVSVSVSNTAGSSQTCSGKVTGKRKN
ncbi:uncharacterized protein C3orf38 homolog [Hyperolius riggenbachi]|uniref:uncharacterized protein C3orf38 homolog n=1 Tax=Hyperolius riggenbachi TaxID=752182 RepID=UPI0035A34E91